MKLTKTAALIIAALVVGVVAGNVVSVSAAPSTDATAPAGLGLRMGAAMRDAGGRLADVVASLTGQTVDEVRDLRKDGTSFADIAAAKDVSSKEVVDAALKVRAEILSERVKAGVITQDQADDALARMETRLTDRVSSTEPGCAGGGSGACGGGGGACGAGGGGRGRGGMGGGGRGGAGACGGAGAPAATQ